VLLKPRFAWHTALLWLGPPGVLIGGALVLLLVAWRRSRPASSSPGREVEALTAAEEARLARLMQSGDR
jgi:cytochrome c-type biogenesis protein CcmH